VLGDRATVGAGTTDVGRDLSLLKAIAARRSVHIVACGGYYAHHDRESVTVSDFVPAR
jgi:predicted metal-dependent phosphotriesterase family hydrolase